MGPAELLAKIVREYEQGRAVVARRTRDRCRDCGDHLEARDHDVKAGYDERDAVVWCRQCFTWVYTDKRASNRR